MGFKQPGQTNVMLYTHLRIEWTKALFETLGKARTIYKSNGKGESRKSWQGKMFLTKFI